MADRRTRAGADQKRRNVFRVDRGREESVQPYIELAGHPSSEQVRSDLAADARPVLLAFSRGKDSLATWLALRDAGVAVIPFYMYRIPGMQFVEKSLRDYEDFFGCHIIRVPHPALYRWLATMTFQAPERLSTIIGANLVQVSYEQIVDVLRDDQGLDADTWCADGIRAADSPDRHTALKQRGPWRTSVKKVAPVWDWRVSHLRRRLKAAGAPLPVDYDWFGRSFDGIDYRYLEPLSRYAPDDYQRVLDWFPLAELELFRARIQR